VVRSGTAYIALDGHRNNDLKPYIFKTTTTARRGRRSRQSAGIRKREFDSPGSGQPQFAVRADGAGFFVSLDDGKNWNRFMPNLPIGRTDEVLVHPRDNDLILATHSRSVWIMDDVSALQRLTPDAIAKPSVLFPTRDAVAWKTIADSARRFRATIGGG
jgi:hypothetical protein